MASRSTAVSATRRGGRSRRTESKSREFRSPGPAGAFLLSFEPLRDHRYPLLVLCGTRTAADAVELIGSTPMVELARFRPGGGRLYAKLEFLNPGGSVKDRAALGMIEAAEAAGRLKPGATIIEPTAGNTGVGLALIGISRGYRVVLVVPEKFVGPKTVVMGVLGAEVVLTPTEPGIQGAIARARELARGTRRLRAPAVREPRQPRLPLPHHGGRDPRAARARARRPGAGRRHRRHASPASRATSRRRAPRCAPCSWSRRARSGAAAQPGPHKVEGIGNSFWPEALDRSLVDEVRTVSDDDSFATVRELARSEGPAGGRLVRRGGVRRARGGARPGPRPARGHALFATASTVSGKGVFEARGVVRSRT